ncbi:MAG TPA: type II toxin-antitoxin system RatA family toxin [Paenalcaligenes sp.]|nr:type II toxin-antitoxin system RatA family toxin [Paenalcaligenes sp.]
MHTVERSVIVPYTPAQMFDLVSDVAKYPEFMPWCGGAEVLSESESGMTASIMIRIARISQSFTTRNTHDYPNRIHLELVDGPFSNLTGDWKFSPLGEDGCKIDFIMQYRFSSRALEVVVGPIFNRIATSFIDSFTERANELYE